MIKMNEDNLIQLLGTVKHLKTQMFEFRVKISEIEKRIVSESELQWKYIHELDKKVNEICQKQETMHTRT